MATTIIYNLFFSLRDGITAFYINRKAQMLGIAYIMFVLLTWHFIASATLFSSLFRLLMIPVYTLILLILILFLGDIQYRGYINNAFQQIGFYSRQGIAPILKYKILYDRNKLIELHFFSPSLSLHDWQQQQLAVENALDITISQIQYGKTHYQDIVITACIGRMDFYSKLLWCADNQTDYSSTILVLGMSMGQLVYNDLRVNPHMLIGGATGSGKTLLLKHILLQCIQKNYRVIILDYKGGVDFSADIWCKHTNILLDKDKMLKGLQIISNEMAYRQNVLRENQCSNIDEYNKRYTSLPRIIVACDEISDLLDVTGLSKEGKELTKEIHACLNTLIRKGRAFGIHLFLATQRPAADIVGGALKNNATCRIAGKCDEVLSRMILDDSIAADMVPKDTVGVFVNQDGIVFKGFVFDENADIKIPFCWYGDGDLSATNDCSA